MADGRKNNGGHSTKGKAGRPPKADEQALIERLPPVDDTAHQKLREAVEDGEQWAIKMFFEYRYGKPSQNLNLGSGDKNLKRLEIEFV
jgi:hypothetical protein